jgi:hypothetical protein
LGHVKPHTDSTAFGRITIDGRTYDHDVLILPSGEIVSRWEALPNPAGSHHVTEQDAQRLLDLGAGPLIIGTGQSGVLGLSREAKAYLDGQGCAVILARTPGAIELYNAAEGPVTALFHLTC